MADISLRLQVRDDGTVVVQNFTKALKQGLEEVEKASKSADSTLGSMDEKLGGLAESAKKNQSILTGFRSNVIFLNQGLELLGKTLGTVVSLFEVGVRTSETLLRTLIRLGQGVTEVTERYIKFSSVLESALGVKRGKAIAEITREIANVSPLLEQQVRGIVQGVALVPSLTLGLRTSDLETTKTTLNEIVDAVQALTVFRSDLPPESALFSFREFLQGQLRSLQFRFDIDPLSILSAQGISAAEFKGAAPIERVEQFIKLSEFLVSKETVRKLSEVPSVLFGNIIEFFQNFGIAVGKSGFFDHVNDILKETFKIINEAFTTGPFVELAKPVSEALTDLLDVGLETATDSINLILDRFLNVDQRSLTLVEKFGVVLTGLIEKLRDGIPGLKDFAERGVAGLGKALDALSSQEFISFMRESGQLLVEFVGLMKDLAVNIVPKLRSFIEFARQNPGTAAAIGIAGLGAPIAAGNLAAAGIGAAGGLASRGLATATAGGSLALGSSLSAIATSGSLTIILSSVAALLAAGVGGGAIGTFINRLITEHGARQQAARVARRETALGAAREDPGRLVATIDQLGRLSQLADIAADLDQPLRIGGPPEVRRSFSPLERRFNLLRNQLLGTGLFDAFNDLEFTGAEGQPGKIADIIRGVQVGLQRQLGLIREQNASLEESVKVQVQNVDIQKTLSDVTASTTLNFDQLRDAAEEQIDIANALINQFTQEGGLQATRLLGDFGLTLIGGAEDTQRQGLSKLFGLGGQETALQKVQREIGQLPPDLQERVLTAVGAAQTGLQRTLSQEFVSNLVDSFSGKGRAEIGQLLRQDQDIIGAFDRDLQQALTTIARNEQINQDRSATFLELRQSELSSAKARRDIISKTVDTLAEQVQTLEDLGKGEEQVTKEERALLRLRRVQLAAEEDRVRRIEEELRESQGFGALRSGIEQGLREISFENPFQDLGKQATTTLRDSFSEGIVDGIRNGGRNAESIFRTFLGTLESMILESAAKTLSNFAVTQLVGFLGNIAGSLFSPVQTQTPGEGGVLGPQTVDFGGGNVGTGFFAANGGILPGSFHQFRQFATGSPVVDRPTMGMIGEGTQAEAVVPLSNGRTIPVQLRGMPAQSSPPVVELTTVNTVDPNLIKQVVAENDGEVIFNVLGSNSKKLRQIISRA